MDPLIAYCSLNVCKKKSACADGVPSETSQYGGESCIPQSHLLYLEYEGQCLEKLGTREQKELPRMAVFCLMYMQDLEVWCHCNISVQIYEV